MPIIQLTFMKSLEKRSEYLRAEPFVGFEEVVELCTHLARQGGPRMVVRAIGVDEVTTGPVDHVAVDSVGEEPGLKRNGLA